MVTGGGERREADRGAPRGCLIDPRRGDVEDDASSTERHSLLRLAGSLLTEISLPRLALSWLLLVALPGVLFGLSPLIASAWLKTLSRTVSAELNWLFLGLLAVLILALGYVGGRHLFRVVERAFWGINASILQPGYALCREGLRHLASASPGRRHAMLQGAASVGAGLMVCGVGLLAALLAWPSTRWLGDVVDLASPQRLVVPALANTVVAVGAYIAAAAPVWGIADARMASPRDLAPFDSQPGAGRRWRVAHLSDLHIVGERYGFRIESGRSGPRGNQRLVRTLDLLDAMHRAEPLDLVLITGDLTDAGRSSEFAELLDIVARYPRLAEVTLVTPGNHDLNIVDRANPARLELPTSPGKRLRQMRTLSAIAAIQGERVRVVDRATRRLGTTLSGALAPHARSIAAFADTASLRLSLRLEPVWRDAFPMVRPPDTPDGLGVILLNSVAETSFSFTNALGLVAAEQASKLLAATRQFPQARWIVALHHHLVEYPDAAKTLSERIGTVLINGSWFVRQLLPLGNRIVALHGHRHVDWAGECSGLRIVSAPSQVMGAGDADSRWLRILTLAPGADGQLCVAGSDRVEIPGDGADA
ncbi:MAG: metallophosphoesterase [Dongiaceae bacterium]